MEFKGTKGKWEVKGHPYFNEEDGYVGAYNITTQNREQTVTAVPAYEFWGQTIETAKANALLISKAPEMLEMLEILLKEFKATDVRTGAIKEDLKQLIKEATTL